MATLTSAFFGSYINPLRQLARCTQVDAVHSDHQFAHVDQFNTVLPGAVGKLEPFFSRQHMLSTVQQWPERDILLVAGFVYRLPMDVIRKFKWVINVHPGNLQTNRGACPVPYSILNREAHIHMTLHLIDTEELDSGPVLLESLLPIDYSKSFRDLHTRVDHLAGTMVLDVVTAIRFGWSLHTQPRAYSPESYRPRLPEQLLVGMVTATSLDEFLQQIQNTVSF